jgi:hypothetical protein
METKLVSISKANSPAAKSANAVRESSHFGQDGNVA